ncbi:SDR family NAD(P)-dependent oxidoreductase [Arthrobacter sp. H16F315]|uniref:SDR family NAD(P)-dependent oxidoreductase n=1 Tax=Arthrobacter sp. H16F315 TaxID=2955314 RepID=UPI002096B227|nr:SDR family NAD(P)-dependent oxidoreductase [Arthrobacter sp. H16F315]MDD1477797.1 SDR family NAD(P)-dependent oxidoreductase [Arthrobacter sp. H16F315]
MDWRFSSGGHRWSRGIGAAISRRLATEGHDVVITYVRDVDAAEKISEHLRQAGQRALVPQVDTTQESSVVELFDLAAAWQLPSPGIAARLIFLRNSQAIFRDIRLIPAASGPT